MISTVASFSKRGVNEEIPGMYNAFYRIPPIDGALPNLLHVGDSFYYKPDLDGRQDSVHVPSEQIARSVVHMHVTSQILYRVDQHPAIFCIPNRELTVEQVMTEFKGEVKELLEKQKRWYIALVQLADDDWQHAKKHQMISDIQRTAAIELGLSRDWLMDIQDEDVRSCPFCGTGLLNPEAPICPACNKVHNPARMAELEAKFAVVNPITGKK